MLFIPLKAVPSQAFLTALNGQSCQINVVQKNTGLYTSLFIDNAPIIANTISLNLVLLVRSAYLGFSGDIGFYDTQGTNDPYYTGLGSRYLLLYLFPNELPPGVS